jgi:hypothetical protein
VTVIPPSLFERLKATPIRDLVRGRLSSKLAWQRHIAICGLPEELKGVVQEVTRRTGLWRSEKVEVAQELIAHFYDGLDAGVAVEELIKRFGDVATAAKLIKRAKKRGRAWPWHVWRRAMQGLGVMFVVWVGLVVWFAMEKPVVSVDYAARLNARVDQARVEDVAWPLYKQAWAKDEMFGEGGLRQEFMSGLHMSGTAPVRKTDPSEPGSPSAHAFVAERKEVIAILRAAGQKELLGLRVNERLELETWRTDPGLMGPSLAQRVFTKLDQQENRMRFVKRVRQSVRLLAADMLDAAAAGDGARAAADYQAMVGMALHTHESDKMMGMVGQAHYSIAVMYLSQVLARYPALLSRAELTAMAQATAQGRAACKLDYTTEKTLRLDFIQHVYSDDGQGDGNFTFAGYRWWKADWAHLIASRHGVDDGLTLALLPAVVSLQYSRKNAVDYVNAYFEELARRNEMPLWECVSPALEEGAGESFQEKFARERGLDTWRNSAFIWGPLPMEKEYNPTSQLLEARADALLAALALETYRRDHGAYPDSLAKLPPGYLKTEPVDHSTGLPLLMRTENGRPILYGRGLDGMDNGGFSKILKKEGKPVELPALSSVSHGEDWILFVGAGVQKSEE